MGAAAAAGGAAAGAGAGGATGRAAAKDEGRGAAAERGLNGHSMERSSLGTPESPSSSDVTDVGSIKPQAHDEMEGTPLEWTIGFYFFVAGSVANFASFSFAAQV